MARCDQSEVDETAKRIDKRKPTENGTVEGGDVLGKEQVAEEKRAGLLIVNSYVVVGVRCLVRLKDQHAITQIDLKLVLH